MNRSRLPRILRLLVLLAWTTAAAAQEAAPPASTPSTEKPASGSTAIDPVVITAPPAPSTTPGTAPAAAPAAPASPAPTTTEAAPTTAASTQAAARPTPRWQPRSRASSTTTLAPPPVPIVAAPATADIPESEGRFVLMGVMDQRWNTHEGYDLFAEDDVLAFLGVTLGADLFSFSEQLRLAVELGWNAASTTRRDLLGGDIGRTELNIHNAQASVVARYTALPWLAPHARLTLGLSFLDMALQSNGDDRTFEDHTTAPSLGIGIGTSLQTPPGTLSKSRGPLSHVQIGLRAELGYTFAADAGFALKDNSDLRVPSVETSLGGLSRSGPSIHTAFFVRL